MRVGRLVPRAGALETSFEVHGVRAVAERFRSCFARGRRGVGFHPRPHRFSRRALQTTASRFGAKGGSKYRVVSPYEGLQACADLELALGALEAELYFHVAELLRTTISIHAGVAVHRGRAIVTPGPAFSGKTTLIAALVRAGALYFSDEYAFLDKDGQQAT